VDYPAVVRAMGGAGTRVSTLDELDAALAAALASDVPTLIECPVDRDEFVTPMLPPGGTMDDLVVNMDDVHRRLQG
jgi:acetolactate synthase-1/2/3 large subunit